MKATKLILLIISLIIVIFIAAAASATENQLQDGCYEVDIKLMHAEKDRPSMGSKGLSDKAELVVNDGKGLLYMKAVPIKEESLTTSLINCYLLEGNSYKKAAAGDWSLELPEVKGERPAVFEIPIDEKTEFLKVLVNPQVTFMGGFPLPARLKIDWNSLNKIKQSPLYEHFKNGKKFTDTQELWISASGISVMPEQQNFETMPELVVSNVLPDEAKKLRTEAGADGGQAWEISLNEPLNEIPENKINSIPELMKPLTQETMTVLLPRSQDEDSAVLYAFSADGGKNKVELKAEGKFWRAEHISSGKFLLTEGANSGTEKLQLNDDKASSTDTLLSGDLSQPENIANSSEMPILSGLPASNIEGISKNTVSPTVGNKKNTTNLSNNVNKNDSNTDNYIQSEKERPGIIITVIAIFLIMTVSGFAVWRKQLPHLMDEIERRRYLQYFERRVLK